MLQLAFTIGDIAAFTGAFFGVLFILYYWLTATWWKSEIGIHLMSFTAYIVVNYVFLSVAVIARRPGAQLPVAGLVWFRLFVYVVGAGMIIWRLSLVVRAQARKVTPPGVPPSQTPPFEIPVDPRDHK